jgi:hypothetical protein
MKNDYNPSIYKEKKAFFWPEARTSMASSKKVTVVSSHGVIQTCISLKAAF